LAALVDSLAAMTAARAFPLPRRVDERGSTQPRLLDTLLAQTRHIFFVHLSEEERGWMPALYEASVRSWPADAVERGGRGDH
jgi:hypothetical protein